MSDFHSLFKHTRNYLFANIATKALTFVSIPVYTRLLSVEEYGVINVFISVIGVAAILLTLNSEVAVSRYFFDAKDENDFKDFVGTTVSVSGIVFLMMASVFFIFVPKISNLLGFPYLLTFALLPTALYQKINLVFLQIYQPLEKSKTVAIVSSVQVYLAFFLSALCIYLLKEEKYYGYVLGTILAMLITAVYMFKSIKKYCNLCCKRSHIRYILNFCIPYIPYSLSGILISQFARVFISNQEGFSSAGVYSLANNLAAIMLVIISTTHDAWNPSYFKYMNSNDNKSINIDYDIIWRGSLVIGIIASLFAYEGGIIMAGADYKGSLYICPVLILGYLFYQCSYVYLRNTAYAKRNIWNAIAVISSGCINVILNAYLIPVFSDMGGALSLFISYFLLMLISYFINRYIIKLYTPCFVSFLLPLLIYLPFMLLSIYLYTIEYSIWIVLAKIVLLGMFCYILLHKYFDKAKVLLIRYLNK